MSYFRVVFWDKVVNLDPNHLIKFMKYVKEYHPENLENFTHFVALNIANSYVTPSKRYLKIILPFIDSVLSKKAKT